MMRLSLLQRRGLCAALALAGASFPPATIVEPSASAVGRARAARGAGGVHARCRLTRHGTGARNVRRFDPRCDVPRLAHDLAAEASLPAGRRRRPRPPASFYIDALGGNDANPGTSATAAWRTLARADHAPFIGGDQLLLRAGETFAGTLRFSRRSVTSTTAHAPFTIGSYGGGQATIRPGAASAIKVVNVAGFHIFGLQLAGESGGCRPRSFGILFLAAHSAGTLQAGIAVDHVDAHGFCDGIAIASGDDGSRFEHVRLTALSAHDNYDAGVFAFDPAHAQHDIRDVYVAEVQAYNNAGTGGIALFGVERGVVEHSLAHDNGRGGSGGVGIWAFDADHITIQFSESYDNRTREEDGDGFDLDGGVSNSTMQYDYSHGNEGIGFLVCGCVPEYAMHDDVVRYDVSQNDGANGQPSALYMLGGERLQRIDVFNNSFYSSAGAGPLVLLEGEGKPFSDLHVRDNLLAAGPGKSLLDLTDPPDAAALAVQGNDWWPTSGPFSVLWGARMFSSLGELRTATGAETLNGKPVGLSAAPETCALGGGETTFPRAPGELRAYELRASSPLLGAGLDLHALFGTEVGANDFGGDPSARAGAFDVGADERQATDTC
jgi:Right handed beta helix region